MKAMFVDSCSLHAAVYTFLWTKISLINMKINRRLLNLFCTEEGEILNVSMSLNQEMSILIDLYSIGRIFYYKQLSKLHLEASHICSRTIFSYINTDRKKVYSNTMK